MLEKLDALLNGPTAPQNGPRPKTVAVEFPGEHVPTPTGPAVERATFVPDGINPGYQGASRNGGSLDDGTDPMPGPPLSPEAVAELRPTIRPALPPNWLDAVPFPTPAQQRAFDALLRERGYAPPKTAAAELVKLDGPWTRLQQAIGEAAKSQGDAYHRHMQDIARRTAEGDESVKREDSWTRSDWDSDASERIAAFKRECKRIEALAWELAAPALREKADACDAAADELENEMRPRFEQFAVPYQPANFILLIRKYASTLRDDSRRNVGLPSSMIQTL